MHLKHLTKQKLGLSSSVGATSGLFYKWESCILILAFTDPSRMLAHDEITPNNLEGVAGVEEEKEWVKQKHFRIGNIKWNHENMILWTGYFQKITPGEGNKEVREVLPFSRAKGDTREYQAVIKDQRLPSDGRWKHTRPEVKRRAVRDI